MIWTRRGLWPSVAIVATHTLMVASASAQQGAGVLTGKIEDGQTKAPIADAVITVTSPALQGEQVVVTDSTGLYRIPALPPGTYTLRIEKETYKPYARDAVGLRSDSTIRIDASLLPEALKAEEVVVVAQAPTVDVGSASTGLVVGEDFTRRIAVSPVLGKGGAVRSFESVAELTPGAKNDGYGVSINGATSPENQ
ncbi:carboxypeptidase regulatory-like domain-containing protein, partial [bacterium]